MALGVYIGCVDKVAAQVQIAIKDLFRFGLVRSEAPILAKRHGAEAERADAQAAVSELEIMIKRHERNPVPPYRNRKRAPISLQFDTHCIMLSLHLVVLEPYRT